MIPAAIFLVLAISCYSCAQLLNHGKFKYSKPGTGFWDHDSDKRKYNKLSIYKTFMVFLSDGYHLMQWLFFNSLSLSITFAIGFDWWLLLGTWSLIHITHWAIYNTLKKDGSNTRST